VLHGVADAARERRLKLGRGRRERLDLRAGALERRVDLRGLDAPGRRPVDALLCPLDRFGIHLSARGYRLDRTAPGLRCPDPTTLDRTVPGVRRRGGKRLHTAPAPSRAAT